MNDEIDKVDNIDRKDLLSKKEKNIKDRIPCLITYNRKLAMTCKIINKHWNVLEINPQLQETFQKKHLKEIKLTRNYRLYDQKLKSA